MFIRNNLVLICLFFSFYLNSQCYIQYTYNSSGNRISRVYVGCGKHSQSEVESIKKLDTILMSSSESRTELILQSFDAKIRTYPNPNAGNLTLETDFSNPGWVYKLTSMTGQELVEGQIKDQLLIIDINHLPAAFYGFTIFDDQEQILYRTRIIKR